MKILLISLLQVQDAVVSGKTGLACTDIQRRWNLGTSKNFVPKRLSQYYVKCWAVVTESLPNTTHHLSHKDFRDSVDTAPIGHCLSSRTAS